MLTARKKELLELYIIIYNQGSLAAGVIAKCPSRFVADDQSWQIMESLVYSKRLGKIKKNHCKKHPLGSKGFFPDKNKRALM